ncbi:hypothetical protein EJP82_20025 [Paenibacillus anaericanus]|uniref:Uncharacterized protein n=1 Tax=Paenibacillus anaericanus TaxID=170367 RepID=A0A433Y504_9BACL|nr:hypothetical protein EJP82_20025 [Paenibacillus anaericanus]
MKKAVWTMLMSDETDKALVRLIQRQYRLSLEFTHKNTGLNCKLAIQGEIKTLRREVKQIINQEADLQGNIQITSTESIENLHSLASNNKIK